MLAVLRSAVTRPIGVTMVYLAIAVFGVVALRDLTVDLLPQVDVPRISITTQYDGVAPEEIETLITRPIEQATSTIEGIDRIEAVSSEGLSRVELHFTWGRSLSEAVDDVRVAIDRTRDDLPEDAVTPSVYKFDLSSVPVAFLGLTGGGDPRRLKYLAEDTLSRRLERVAGVASVDVNGGRDREIRVALDSDRLLALGVTAQQVIAALARENRTVSAGDMRDAGREVVIRTEGEFQSLEDIEDVVVEPRPGAPVRVRDLGLVVDSIREVRSELWVDGAPGMQLRVYKQSGENTVAVAERLQQEIARIHADYAGALEVSVLWDASDFIKAAVTNVRASAAVGALLAIMVLLLFLRDLRATLIIATAIPLSLLATFGLMYFRGMTLNVISLGGLALGIGMLVDGAIVILESIHRRRAEGLTRTQASIEGAREVAGAVIAGTLTTVAVFAPVVFVGDFAGVFFGEMALVVTFALACSLAVALTLVPMLAGRFLAPKAFPSRGLGAPIERAIAGLEQGYARVVQSALTAPWAIVVGALVLLGASGALVSSVGFELMSQADEGRLKISLELPVGTPLERTSETVSEIARRARAAIAPEELNHLVRSAGPEAWWRPGGSHEGEVDIMLVPESQRERGIAEIERAVRSAVGELADARLRIRQSTSNILMHIVRRGEDRLSIDIRGHDLGTADRLAAQVVSRMQDIPGITYARPSRELGQLERVLHVDRRRAAELGLGSAEIAQAVETYVLGRVATRLREQGDEFDVRVALRDEERSQLEQLETLPIVAPDGRRVPLGTLVRIEARKGPSSIFRQNQERTLRVDLGTADRPLNEIAADVRQRLAGLPVPDGFDVALGGELSEQQETFTNLSIGILLAVFLVYAVMAIQFESLRHPLVVMAAVPFAFIGAILALLLTGTTFNMNSFLGTIVLVGIVVNNAIVLVDYTNVLRREHQLSLTDALVAAGQRRLRPILMTTATTVLGLAPLAMGSAEGSEVQAPLARVVVGGLLSSTLVTLVLVPCLYLLMERRRGGRVEAEVPSEAPAARAAQ